MKQLAPSLLILMLVASCAHDVAAHFPGTANVGSGEIEIALTGATRNLFVTIDDRTLVHHAHTQKVVIDNVPAGLHRVRIAMGGDGLDGKEHETTVDVSAQNRVSAVVAAPNLAVSQAVLAGAVYLGEMIALGAVLLTIY